MITLIVNERTVELNDGSTLLDAAREAGVYIPTLCYHPRLPRLSTTKSPQQMHGALTKRGVFARSLGAEFAEGKVEPYVVSVMPCTARKDEAVQPGVAGDLDHVLTTRELARMIRARGIAFSTLSEEGEFDHPLGESTGAGQIFVASGGVMEAVVRTASHFIGEDGDQKACSGNLVIKAGRVF